MSDSWLAYPCMYSRQTNFTSFFPLAHIFSQNTWWTQPRKSTKTLPTPSLSHLPQRPKPNFTKTQFVTPLYWKFQKMSETQLCRCHWCSFVFVPPSSSLKSNPQTTTSMLEPVAVHCIPIQSLPLLNFDHHCSNLGMSFSWFSFFFLVVDVSVSVGGTCGSVHTIGSL